MSIQHLLYVERDVGGTVKSTKKQFIWEFELDGKPQKIELFDSKWSGKKKIIKNGRVECEVQDQMSFFRSFDLNGHTCTIIQYGEKNELRIDNQSFSHLYNLEKNKTFFNQESGPTSNSMQAKPLPPSKGNQYALNNNFYSNTANLDNKPQLFNFNIKPAEQANQPSKQFQFKSDISSSVAQQKTMEIQPQTSNMNQGTGVNLLDLANFSNPNDDGNQYNPNVNVNPLEDKTINANDLFDVFSNANQIGNSNNGNPYTQKSQGGGNDIIDLLGNNNQNQMYGGMGNNNNQFNTMNMNSSVGMGIMGANPSNYNQKSDIYSLQENLQSSQLNQQQVFNSNFQPNQFFPHNYNNNPNTINQSQHNNNGNFGDFFH